MRRTVRKLQKSKVTLAHWNCSDFCDCDAHRGPQKSQRFPRQEKAMLHCDLRVRWKVASDLWFRAAISEPSFWRFGSVNAEIASDCDCAISLTPPILAFLAKTQGRPEKSKDFSFCRTLNIPGKEGKNAQKSKEKRKTKKARRTKKARIGGSGILVR